MTKDEKEKKNQEDLSVERRNKTANILTMANRYMEENLDTIQNNITVFGKTLNAWNKYFQLPINEADDLVMLRMKLAKLNDLLDEFSYMYSNIKLTNAKLQQEESVSYNVAFQLAYQSTKNVSASERLAKDAISKVKATKDGANMIFVFFEEIYWRLKNKMQVLEVLIYSKNGELRHLDT